MNNNHENTEKSVKFVNKLYDKLGYFDLYGNSVIIFIFVTLFVFLVYSYCSIMQTKEAIAADWTNQRCNPKNIPFAGYINKPDGKTAFEYTGENFQYCVQNILVSITGYALEPLQYMVSALTNIFNMAADAINKIRDFINLIRDNIKKFVEDVMQRILNVMIPIQKMFIALMDTFNKVQGTMTAGLYTMLGSYYTLQSLMGAILELIIKILVALVIIIVGLWIMPFTWPAAASMTVVFLAIAIPLSIIVYFMTEVLHIKTSGIPQLRCFDKNTEFVLQDKTKKPIAQIEPGDILAGNVKVMSKIKVLSRGLRMYNLNGIIVSESHIVKYMNQWIPVSKHCEAKELPNYGEPYLYCLNTSSKTIILNNMIFTDWDEIYDEKLSSVLKHIGTDKTEYINQVLDKGFEKDVKISLKNGTKNISEILPGDCLSEKGIVYGIVELHKNNLGIVSGKNEKLYHLLVSNKKFEADSSSYQDYNSGIDSILEIEKILSKEYV
jgi:hypothetical protein